MTMNALAAALAAGSGVFALLAIHPFVTYPASLLALRAFRARRRPAERGVFPTIALLMSAFEEEAVIVEKAENLLAVAATVPGTEVLIYVDAGNDATAKLLEPYDDRITVVRGTARRGKSHGLEILTSKTRAEILVFSDANVMLALDSIELIGRRFRDAAVGCVSGRLLYSNAHESVTASTGTLYWRVEEAIQKLESDTVGMVGVDGSLFAVRRCLKPHVPDDLIDDFLVSMDVALQGHAVVKADDALAYERNASDAAQEFSRKIRVGCQSFNVHRALWPRVLRSRPSLLYAYVSHRLLKWLIAYDLAAAGILAVAAACLLAPPGAVLSGVALACVLIAAAWRLGVPGTAKAASISLAFVGAAAGVARSLQGERYQTWAPVSTSRRPSPNP